MENISRDTVVMKGIFLKNRPSKSL